MAAVLEAAASVECAEIYLVSRDGNALMSCSEAIVENPDTWQMRDIFLQYAKGIGMRFEPKNVGVGELAMKINN